MILQLRFADVDAIIIEFGQVIVVQFDSLI